MSDGWFRPVFSCPLLPILDADQDLEEVFILYFEGLECIAIPAKTQSERVLSKVSLLFCSMQTLEKPSCLFTKLHLAEELRHLRPLSHIV